MFYHMWVIQWMKKNVKYDTDVVIIIKLISST